MLYKLTLALAFFFLLSQSSFSQERIGLQTGKYAGINSVFSNPALSSQSALNWDINIFGGHFFAETDYAFVRNTNFFHFLKNSDAVTVITDLNNPVDSIISMPLYFDTNRGNKSASLKGSLMGPSAMFNIGNDMTAGFFLTFNVNGTAQNIPESLGYYELKDLPISQLDNLDSLSVNIHPFQSAAMSWSEIGLHLSKTLIKDSYTNVAVGLNFKYLIGYDGIFAKNNNAIVLNKLESEQYLLNNIEAELGFTTTVLDSSSLQFNSNGKGIAFDLGISFKNEESQWGVSLLDLGYVRFKNNAEVHTYSAPDLSNIAGQSYQNLEDYRAFISQVSQDITEVNPDSTSISAQSFSIWLPTALSAQYDRKLTDKFFVNVNMVHRLPIGNNRLERDNIVSVAPRFETRLISLYLPLTLYDLRKIHLGFAARIGVFSVGSDNLSSLFGKSDFDGTDIYAGVKINPFRSAKNSGKEIKCFYFE